MFAILLSTVASPGSNKISEVVNHLDPYGLGITAIGMAVVFFSLILLYSAFFNIAKFLLYRKRKSLEKTGTEEKQVTMEAGVNAVIALALSLYMQEIHDKEAAILTISRTSRSYSPWSSKIYGLRQSPR